MWFFFLILFWLVVFILFFPGVTFLFGTANHRQSVQLGVDISDGDDDKDVDGFALQEGAIANWSMVGGWKKDRRELAVLSKLNLPIRIVLRIILKKRLNELDYVGVRC